MLAGAVGGAGYWLSRHYLPPDRALPGVVVGGSLPSRQAPLRAWLERRRALYGAEEAFLRAHGESLRVERAELGIELDVDGTEQRVLSHATRGTLAARLARAHGAREGTVELPFELSFDRARARRTLEQLTEVVRRAPVDARLDMEQHQKVPDVDGAELDIDATLTAIELGERGELPVFDVVLRPVPARVTLAMLTEVDIGAVLGAYETDFGGTGEGRAINIARAARYLDGTVLAPGQVLSFNERVGPRTFDRGFALAPVIIDDELDAGVGGGVCQVASTLHAAAVFGSLDVVQRRSHSRPSAYTQLGLDATVVWGEVDLKLRNPYETPILVHAFRPSATKLRIEILGRQPPGKVEYTYGVARTKDFYRRVTTKPWLGQRSLRRQRGRRGMEVVSRVRLLLPNGETRDRHYYSEYRPVPEVFWVGPELDPGALPALPEGAERLEVDGLPRGSGVFLGALAATSGPPGT